ncbi:class II aldolase and adducin N-terminal domain-containing protein [Campylobacter lari]|uniref:class II aldolase and adducin N-terminal domain-containing protein n=1 Tax=Campylobacter lari TaxID=201 RepID=UPI0021526E2B|nr:class II aldolase and adducin N-terminal domain-containing protein [Campylobacter lari]MCR6518345.1 class II aldolase and adducin N-terminal domain-containing protein [Campylobacter lari]MCR6526575.1 class II aldolase and adducin N-terminal domain-containing protein [Campylobacter lari]
MNKENIISQIKILSTSMFKKNFFGICHGSVSAKLSQGSFIINKNNAFLNQLDEKNLSILKFAKDYSWDEASSDSEIHKSIYENIPEAKFICFACPTYTLSMSLNHDFITPQDYFGEIFLEEIRVYNPKSYEDWEDRSQTEIYRSMLEQKQNFVVVKGYGIFAYGRTSYELGKIIDLIENSCKIIHLAETNLS